MSKVDELKIEIERLPEEEFTELVRWLSEKDWERWDKQIEADSGAGKLDFLIREALDAKAKRTLKDLCSTAQRAAFGFAMRACPNLFSKLPDETLIFSREIRGTLQFTSKRLASFGR